MDTDFQDPQYKRHDRLGLNYRMPEVAAALGLAQTERLEHFVNLRISIAKLYLDAIEGCEYLVPQVNPKGSLNSYWTFVVKYENKKVSWYDFRNKFVEFGGDGIYACWALSYNETVISEGHYKSHCPSVYEKINFPQGICPVAEELQPKLMQFVTNYGSVEEAKYMADALRKTINHFS